MNVTTNATSLADIYMFDDANITGYCSLCPGGLDLPIPNRTFIGEDPISCGELDDLLTELETKEDCVAAQTAFNDTFNPSVYCHCPSQEATGICSLCPDEQEVIEAATVNGETCGDYQDLARAATSWEFCLSILEVEGIVEACCEEGGNVTLMGVDEEGEDDDAMLEEAVLKAGEQANGKEAASTSDAARRNGFAPRQQLVGLGVLLFLAVLGY